MRRGLVGDLASEFGLEVAEFLFEALEPAVEVVDLGGEFGEGRLEAFDRPGREAGLLLEGVEPALVVVAMCAPVPGGGMLVA